MNGDFGIKGMNSCECGIDVAWLGRNDCALISRTDDTKIARRRDVA